MRPIGGRSPVAFRVLYVCVHNVCRSVLAERLARSYLANRQGAFAEHVYVGSAGTRAIPGQPMHPYVGDVLRTRDADIGDFTSKRLTARLVMESDLVLAATAEERDRAISMAPAALGRTFTICEFARLVGLAERGYEGFGVDAFDHDENEGADGSEGGVARTAGNIVHAAHQMRGQGPYVPPVTDDIPDPPPTREAFEKCADRVEKGVWGGLGLIRRVIDHGDR
ncbi:protein tyrosine phosphatase [Phytoactinopolyspora mesophila]|uniref:arsenate reductase/protein-tyrosine-phosphatase family protein n=1 Tax=Phytoactinopolyspora mesophila TaxID=2650750 RepID=UPI001391FE7E